MGCKLKSKVKKAIFETYTELKQCILVVKILVDYFIFRIINFVSF